MNWSNYPSFTRDEMGCQHTGKDGITERLMDKLQRFRFEWGKPMRVTSGYRHPTHPIEARKQKPGEHASGLCADIAVSVAERHEFVRLAFQHGFTRIGIADTFVHLGVATEADGHPSPRVWTY